MMNEDWKITNQFFDGKKYYAIYRILNPKEPDHSGNRKYAVGYIFTDEKTAQTVATELNKHVVF